mgnify:CR=1 FL=1
MGHGIDKTLEVFDDLGVLAVSGISIAKEFKHGVGIGAIIGSVGKLLALSKSVEELVKDVPASLPELLDLDGQESAKVASAAYVLVKKIVDAIKA